MMRGVSPSQTQKYQAPAVNLGALFTDNGMGETVVDNAEVSMTKTPKPRPKAKKSVRAFRHAHTYNSTSLYYFLNMIKNLSFLPFQPTLRSRVRSGFHGTNLTYRKYHSSLIANLTILSTLIYRWPIDSG